MGISNIIKDSQDIFTMKCLNKKIYIIALLFILILPFASFADGWIDDGRGNWLYEENGELLKNTWKNIDGINYYFDTQGNWLPTEPLKDNKLVGSERVTFYMEGKDEKNRKYKTKVSVPRPIIGGTNADAINEFIKKEFQNTITKYYEETKLNGLFLMTEIEIGEMLEAYNQRGVIGLGYFGGGMFNLYIDTKKFEMWAMRNVN